MAVYPEALVHAASAGDRDAIAALLAAAQPDIRRYARRTCRTTSDVEDAVQETLFVLYRRLGMLRRVGSLSAWLFVIVHRFCLSLASTIVGVPLDPYAIDREVGTHKIPVNELRLDLANAIQSLPPNYRDVILLRDVEELTIDEIAQSVGASREAVKARLNRARIMLREYLLR
jgi:RNA polymerase sigma factor (sigma-70 family)